ncbi:MAG: hypothetical protein ACRYGR_08185 [Janthinobacterium lividum]
MGSKASDASTNTKGNPHSREKAKLNGTLAAIAFGRNPKTKTRQVKKYLKTISLI